jgi:hypothetical protein
MGFKSLVFGVLATVCSIGFAGNGHFHSSVITHEDLWGNCEIEIINRSNVDVQIFGIFDDGSSLRTFKIAAVNDSPHYIPLFYADYCHEGMALYVSTLDGHQIYSGFWSRKQPLILDRIGNPGKSPR